MAGRGPIKQADSIRSKDHKDQIPTTKLKASGIRRGPELPTDITFHPRTHIWWENWRTSALAEMFGQTDWDYLLETAILQSAFWYGNLTLAGELRLRVAKFGATPEDRQRLRAEITSPDVQEVDAPKTVSKKKSAAKLDRKVRLSVVPDIAS